MTAATPVAVAVPRVEPRAAADAETGQATGRIEIEDLSAYYGAFRAVRDVSMTIRPHAVTAIIGPSGCGKSTFLRSLNRMHELDHRAPASRASSCSTATDLYARHIDPVQLRRIVGMVFQRPNPFPTMSIYDNVVAGPAADRPPAEGRAGRDGRALPARRRRSGTRSRTSSSSPARRCRAGSSSGCASRGRSPSTRRSC